MLLAMAGMALALLLPASFACAQSDSVDIPALLSSLGDRDPYASGKAAEALSRIGQPAVSGLIGILQNGQVSTRWPATIALAKMGPVASPALSALIHTLTDSSTQVRWGSVMALGSEVGHDTLIAGGHDADGSPLGKTRYTHPNAAYSLYVSAEDYARFLLAHLPPGAATPRLLTQSSIDTMLSHQVVVHTREPVARPGSARGTGVFWGLGWCINSTPQGDIIHHSGSNRSGFRCFSQFSPSRGSALVILTNGAGGTALWERLVNRIGNF